MRSIFQNQYLAIIWVIFILIMCFMPATGDDKKEVCFFEGFDKVVHLGLFFVLVVLLFHGNVKQYEYCHITTILKITLLAVILGATTELLQWKVFTYRSGDWWDFFADTLGAAMGTFSYVLLGRNKVLSPTDQLK